jgi:adenylate kinase family enzyme
MSTFSFEQLKTTSDLRSKIVVVGQGGKSTLSRALSKKLNLPYIELDGNYFDVIAEVVATQAETVIYVNMSWRVMMWRIFWRSLDRIIHRKPVCGGNYETWRKSFFSPQSLLWYLIKNRNSVINDRPGHITKLAKDLQLIKINGRNALDRFYTQNNLSRG